MERSKIIFLLLICLFLNSKAQQTIPELQKFNNKALFNPNDTNCFNLKGEWIGEEIQYDATGSFIKVKFKVVFKLKQEGNRVYGTSFIQDKYRGSYGDMKIRGMVSGNKLFFEEYEIMNEKFFQLGVVWCLRSGEMNIKIDGTIITLDGLQYNGYASDSYMKCTDYAKMSVSKVFSPIKSGENENNQNKSDKIETKGVILEKLEVLVFPNPFIDETTISYELKESSKVRIDIYSLSGAYIQSTLNEQQTEGKQNVKIKLSSYAPGIYLVRLHVGNASSTKQIVKMK
ncbi:MAG: T9SS type A sorting domain-containing protein [Bacteroidota bacterium]|nr:T9SS type A sorting domain-containing protein [Bacteroidota bacterium]